MTRDESCALCPMSIGLSPAAVGLPARGTTKNPDVLVVTKLPLGGSFLTELLELLNEAGYQGLKVAFTAVNRCFNVQVTPSKADQKVCATTYLLPEIAELKPKWTLALGAEALLALTGKRQIMSARGEHPGNIFATISPAMVKRNPGQREGLISDLSRLRRLVAGTDAPTAPPERILVVRTRSAVKRLQRRLRTCYGVSYDIESNMFDEFKPDSVMVSVSFTVWDEGDTAPREVWALPLGHPESPFVNCWREVLASLKKPLKQPARRVAHNGKFDGRWMKEFGAPVSLTFDTMLAAHLLNENRPKGLKALGPAVLGVAPWGIDTKNLMNEPLNKVLKYNALDTWYTAHLYFVFREQLKQQPRLARLMIHQMVPASNEFTDIERRGIWVDREALDTRAEISRSTLADIDRRLGEYIPERDEWPAGIKEANFNPSNFLRWWLFDHLKFPVLKRGKEKENGDPGDPSVAEGIMEKLVLLDHPAKGAIELLMERTKWQKYSSAFFAAYQEQIDDRDRIHTTFKLTGTVTGRLSSGKGDDDKVSGRVQNRGVNLQQVPRDTFVRGVFGAPAKSVFVECDYSQIELRLAAHLAQEPTMLHLYQTGQDIHTSMGMTLTGKPKEQLLSEERKKAKAVNFGFLYGMGGAKFIETAWNNYGLVVTENEARAFRRAFFTQFAQLPPWHTKQRRLVETFARVESPLGRVRHLPDIRSADPAVRAEAQRQAINSPVQSFASDMTVLSLIALSRWFREEGLRAHSVGTVHDAINFEVPLKELDRVVPKIRQVMENLPLEKKFGIHLTVPIVADVKVGTRWGGSLEIPNEVSSSRSAVREWILSNL